MSNNPDQMEERMPEENATGDATPQPDISERSLATDIAIIATPIAAAVGPIAAEVVKQHLDRPKQQEPNTDVVLPPGVSKD